MMRALALLLVLTLGTQAAAQNCRLALALGLDVSGSVDAQEYRLQLDGVAAALQDAGVRDALFSMPGAHVELAVYQWGAPWQQRLLLDWTPMLTPADSEAAAALLRATSHRFSDPSTGIGPAISFGAALLSARPECWAHKLDISGDGPANSGTPPGQVALPGTPRITINGLVVNPKGRDNTNKDLSRTRTLRHHYETQVLRGPGAFLETALDFTDFERAMTRKLLREVEPAVFSTLRSGTDAQARAQPAQ